MSEGSTRKPEGFDENRKGDGFWAFDDVQERLVEAYRFLRRLPDREARFLRVAISSLYQQINPLAGLTAVELRILRKEQEQDEPRMPPLTRDQLARMEQTLKWLEWVQPDARKIVHVAVADLASGRRKRIQWGSLISDPTVSGSADRMRMTYNRSITMIANRLNSPQSLA